MPNYCDNFLEIFYDSNNAEQVSYLTLLKKSIDDEALFNFLKPMPEDQLDNWYDWSINNWGTKWDICDPYYEDDGQKVSITFTSAWSPPTLATSVLRDKGFVFVHYYFEGGVGFYGIFNNDGETSSDIKFNCRDVRNIDLVRNALIEMCNFHQIDSAIVHIFGMEYNYHNPDAEPDEICVGFNDSEENFYTIDTTDYDDDSEGP